MSHIPDCKHCERPIYDEYKVVFDVPMHPRCAAAFEAEFFDLKEGELLEDVNTELQENQNFH